MRVTVRVYFVPCHTLSCIGTRYHSRGLNVHGAVSNFVETEQILVIKDTIASYVQIRGSIPVFWRQRVNIQYSPPIEISANASTVCGSV